MKFPTLKLTFADDGGYPLLVDAEFKWDERTAVSRKLVIHPPQKKTFRALCILMLLAKYRGKAFADESGFIWFQDKRARNTWIKTLGISFGLNQQVKLSNDYFNHCQFLSASRGSGHVNKTDGAGLLPSAKFQVGQLPLENFEIRHVKRGAAVEESLPLAGEELAAFAAKLERYKLGKSDGWEPIVPELVAETKRDRPVKPAIAVVKPGVSPEKESSPFVLSARWQELFLQVRDEIKQRSEYGGQWYAVCLVPRWLTEWGEILTEAVTQHQGRVKVAYHSPLGAKESPAVKAQWRMNSSGIDPAELDVVDLIPKRIARLKNEMGAWVDEAGDKGGSFEFFESRITHPFMGIMQVPAVEKPSPKMATEAPAGTWCLLSLYPFYQTRYERRCGLYLNAASPMLDIYYHSIVKLFEQGPKPKEGYLKRVDLALTGAGKMPA